MKTRNVSHGLLQCAPVALFAVLTASAGFAQAVNPEPASNTQPPAAATPARKAPVETVDPTAPVTPAQDDLVVMSPFEVTAEQPQGYLASSSLSGTRLNSKLEDIAASITVVTKQQLLDTASVDINDVFMYEGNTEGIYQYTEFTLDRDVVIDTVAQNPSAANRVRGLGSANVAVGGYGVSGNVPIDTYNIDAIEISRGPNSTLFGLGNTSGGVNVISGAANLSRQSTTVSARVDSSGGYRGTLNINRPIIKDVLSVRFDALHENKGFERKPSSEKTNRATISVTAKPFKKTQIKLSYETYHNFNRRPNSTTPRDVVSEWITQGRPVWNPITSSVRYLDNTSITPFTVSPSAEATLLPTSILTGDSGFQGRPAMRFDDGLVTAYHINRTPAAGKGNPNDIGGTLRLMQTGTAAVRNAAAAPLFVSKSVTDQSIYDWTSVNINAPNWAKSKTDTFRLELEQYFMQSPTRTLAFQGGMYREDSDSTLRYFLANSDGAKSQVMVDINEYMLDGNKNPDFLRPYIGGSQPTFYASPERNENYRGTLAFIQDFTKNDGWTKWLGRHHLSGYGEYRKIEKTTGKGYLYRERLTKASFIAPGANLTSGNGYATYPMIFVGDANGSNVDYAPVPRVDNEGGAYTLRYYNAITNQWVNENVTTEMLWVGNQAYRSERRTQGGVWQGFFLDDRIIPTIGVRKDRSRDHRSAGASIDPATGRLNEAFRNSWTIPWAEKAGTTRTKGIVVKPLSWLILHLNQSDSFIPASVAYNIFGGELPNPTGEGLDYGFTLSLMKGKLVIKANKYKTDEKNKRGTMGTIMNRMARLDFDDNTVDISGDPDLFSFLRMELRKAQPGITDLEIDARASTLMGKEMSYFRYLEDLGGNMNDTNTAISKGHEIEVYYSPTRHLTLKANITQQQAIDTDLSPLGQEWLNQRLPTWTTVKSPFDGSLFWNGTYKVSGRTPKEWYELYILKDLRLATALQGKPKPQTREWRVNMNVNYKLAGITDNKWLKRLDVGGALRWEDQGAIGFFGGAPEPDGAIRSLDATRPVWDKARTYFDFNTGYSFRFANGKALCRVQLNVRNLFEDGRLQAISVNPDGNAWGYRIIDPRQFILTTTFEL